MHSSGSMINRRPLSPSTEAELRRACQAFAKYNKGDGDSAKPDFELIHRYMSDKHPRPHNSSRPSHPHPNRRRDDSSQKRNVPRPGKQSMDVHVPSASLVPFPANVGYRRDSPSPHKIACADKPHNQRQDEGDYNRKRGSENRHKMHANWTLVDSDDSYSTPLTTSTDVVYNSGSTAMTSLASPNREPIQDCTTKSRLEQNDIRSKKVTNRAHGRDEAKETSHGVAAARPCNERVRGSSRELSRTRSITGEIRDYFRPGSANRGNISRSSSQDSMRDDVSGKRRGSTSIWRSWSLRRKESNTSLSIQPGHSQDDRLEKPVPDLNRELPPLPGLDQWKGDNSLDETTRNNPKAHISQLMVKSSAPPMTERSMSKPEQIRLPKTRNELLHLKPTTALNHPRNGTLSDDATRNMLPRRSLTGADLKQAHAIVTDKENAHPVKTQASKGFDFDALLSAMERTEIGQEWIKPQRQAQERASPTEVLRTTTSAKYSLDQNRGDMPNFSRKISCEAPRRHNTAPIDHTLECSNYSPKQTKGLRRVFGGLLTRKKSTIKNWAVNGREDHCQQGVGNNFVLHDEAADAPVIRY
ncbi:hypothetical protein EJ05DRAFT_496306 [Pseudovirgaria hyperparasitica]|uniref:Uncharacterized protein n=1 Tax=Pseudovirgaria hyperparasitica TaxID=470096 RepID=A0A6A6WN29_9PEZI|nr:uncharacterized protein EJ05DRAFT_496306 [Pseudovirgaria hyperparasitica]KAF2763486.1 hypothetical protein EJ05DRAFT_496306 [Pseudovirgaria hyperparasitica]